MNKLSTELGLLRNSDADLAAVMTAYAELERTYVGALEAMGLVKKPALEVKNSANVGLSFSNTSSTATEE